MNHKLVVASVVKSLPATMTSIYIQHEGAILTVGSIAFSGAAIAMSVKNSRDILAIIDDGKHALGIEKDREIRKKIYISVLRDLTPKAGPIIGFYAASIACTLVNKKHTDKKIAELTAALGLAQNAITQYQLWQKEAEKELGEKVDIVNKAVTEETVKKHPDAPVANVPTANETYLYYDIANQRKMWSERTPREILDWAAQSSYDLYDGNVMNDMLTQNDLYDFIGKGLRVQGGDYYIWTPDQDYHGQRSSDLVKVWLTPYEFPDGTLGRAIDTNARPAFRREY